MITKCKEVKKHSISYQNYQALCDYLVYNGTVEEYSKALNKLKTYFIVEG